jgi:hypothetical protein
MLFSALYPLDADAVTDQVNSGSSRAVKDRPGRLAGQLLSLVFNPQPRVRSAPADQCRDLWATGVPGRHGAAIFAVFGGAAQTIEIPAHAEMTAHLQQRD